MKTSPNPTRNLSWFLVFLLLPLTLFSLEPPVYLTWKTDPQTTMVVQWITDLNNDSNDVFYRKIGERHWKTTAGIDFPLPHRQPYLIHRTELISLESGTSYEFKVGEPETPTLKFRTMPSQNNQPIRFVVGGDMYHDELHYLTETNRQAASMDPLFALVGGDIAYASSKKPHKLKVDEGKRWLTWINAWADTMITPDGYLIPFLPAIGNHDVNGYYDQPKTNALFFYTLFSFPGPQGYNVLDFGDYLSLFVLDSGHTNPIPGQQANWLKQALEERSQVPHTFAIYHVPAYPSVRKYKGERNQLIRHNWVPAFEAYSLTAAFEHHDHAYKRTYPLYQGQIDPQSGVLYFGDGAWGVKKARTPHSPSKVWYLATAQKERHFILVSIDGNEVSYYGIKSNGEVIDHFLGSKG